MGMIKDMVHELKAIQKKKDEANEYELAQTKDMIQEFFDLIGKELPHKIQANYSFVWWEIMDGPRKITPVFNSKSKKMNLTERLELTQKILAKEVIKRGD